MKLSLIRVGSFGNEKHRRLFHITKTIFSISSEVQRAALERIGRQFGVKELDDWYSVKTGVVWNKLKIIHPYHSSLFDALKTFYPHHKWDRLRFCRVPAGSWTQTAQRHALEKLGRERFGVKELDDWYNVSSEELYNELSFIANYYKGSLYNALKTLYPQHKWDRFRFAVVPRGYWTDLNSQRHALERFGREHLGVKELDDWYTVPTSQLYNKLSFIGNYYNRSLIEALKTLYPQHNWDPLRFSRVSKGYWSEDAQLDAFERIGREQLGVKELDDWYSVPTEVVYSKLSFIRQYYNGSLFKALKTLYPEHGWDILRFSRVPGGYWKQESTVQYYRNLFMAWKKAHDIHTLSDWYTLPPHQVEVFKRAARGIFGSKMKLLAEWFPETVWQYHLASQLSLKVITAYISLQLMACRIYSSL